MRDLKIRWLIAGFLLVVGACRSAGVAEDGVLDAGGKSDEKGPYGHVARAVGSLGVPGALRWQPVEWRISKVRLLLERGAKPNVRAVYGPVVPTSPLVSALSGPMLVSPPGWGVQMLDEFMVTAENAAEVVRLLVASGADPDRELEPDRLAEPFSARGLLNVARARLKEPPPKGFEGDIDAEFELRPQPGYEREQWLGWGEACLEAMGGA